MAVNITFGIAKARNFKHKAKGKANDAEEKIHQRLAHQGF
jgi:hypothetical protein